MVLLIMKKILKYICLSLITVIICNIFFIAIYSFSALIPKASVINSLQKSQLTGVLKTPITSIERSTTGLGLDYGTECAAIAIGLKTKPEYRNVNKFLTRFYDGYLVSGSNIGVFDPCSGLVEIIKPTKISSEESQLKSYARNWWGMSILIQLGILLFGLATIKAYLFILTLVSLGVFYRKFSKYFNDWKIGIFLLFPLILFGDFQELHNSFPYSLFTIQLFLSAWITIIAVNSPNYRSINFFILAIILGSIYNFVFWFDFHLVLTLIPIIIYLMLVNRESYKEIYKKIFVFLFGYSFGFLITTLIKWFISVAVFGNEIWVSIKDALGLRLSSGSSGLNAPLSEYSSAFSRFPLSLRAVALNFMVFASKFIDPRNASLIGIFISCTLIIIFIIIFMVKIGFKSNFTYVDYLAATPVLLIPFFYYALTPNHSFNHAVLSYRAIPISLGFILSFIYLGKVKNDFSKLN